MNDNTRPDAATQPAPQSRTGTGATLSDAELDQVTGGLVVPAIIAILTQPVLVKSGGELTPDQFQQLKAGNPLPRPR
jgi:hypothetical protein